MSSPRRNAMSYAAATCCWSPDWMTISRVAVDNVGAGMHDIVLAEEYFALNKERYKAMSVVAIVENVFRDA